MNAALPATRERPEARPKDGHGGTTLQLTVRQDIITVHGLLVAETVELVLGAVCLLGTRGWSEVTVDVAGIQAVDAAAAADLAAAQTRLWQAGTRLRIQAPYASTRSMFPQCVLELSGRQNLPSRAERVDGAARPSRSW